MAIDKILGISGSSITWTNKQIAKMIEKNSISFDNEVQRADVWNKTKMSELIWSIIMGFPVPPVYTVRGITDNEKVNNFDVLDGRQRCTTIYKFLNDKFELVKLKPIPYLDENGKELTIDISGKKFSELDEELQDIIRDATITVKYFDNLEQSKRAEMFRRLNNGQPLSAKARTLASAKNITKLLDIGSHELFEAMLTEKARQNKNQAIIVTKAWTMLNRDLENISFASKDFNPMVEEVEISDNEKLELNTIFEYVLVVHDELMGCGEKAIAKKLYTEVHLVSLIRYIKKAIDDGITEVMMAEWLINFFKTENDSDIYAKYNNACSSGVARPASIQARHGALGESYAEFFKKDIMEKEDIAE